MIERINLKFAAVVATLMLGLATPVSAAPDQDNSVDASADAASTRYDSAEVIEKILTRSRDNERAGVSLRRSADANRAGGSRTKECLDCPAGRRYDDRKVVKKVRNVDHSRVINTVTVVPAKPRVRESNRLVIQKNETRHVGVVQHNHTIIEKEVRYVQRAPVTTVNFVTHNYRVVERPAMVAVRVVPSRTYECGVGIGRYQNSCGPTLRVRD